MTLPVQDPQPGTRAHVLAIAQRHRWGTIQDYVERCRAQGSVTPAFDATAIAQMERIHVRRRLKQITDSRGWPLFGTIERARDDGRPARVCLQEVRFGPEAYRQVVAYHDRMARHHLFKVQTDRDHAKARDGLPRPRFDEDHGAVGGTGGA